MKDISAVDVVVAKTGADGKGYFVDAGTPARFSAPGIVDVAFVWGSKGTPSLPDGIGTPPAHTHMHGPGGSTFGIVCYAPNSAGKFDEAQRAAMGSNEVHDDGMHKTESVDYDIVISGKIDVYLDGGEMRTLSPGSMIVMAGANHSWQNPYDEPCIFATVNLGATNSGG
jgi:mannose-6-phosphate isomerase-like protein (cupin superfamily)